MINKPLLLAWSTSEERREKIEHAAMNYSLRWLPDHFATSGDAVAMIADAHPVLLICDLDQPLNWLTVVRSEPATRRIPLIALVSIPAVQKYADGFKPIAVINPDDPTLDLAVLIDKYVRLRDQVTDDDCDQPLPPLVIKGLEEFNAGEYFECHESLETAWRAEPGPIRDLYQAILQVSVAYLQITRGNYNGALKMFLRAVQWFQPLPDQCRGVDIAQLRTDLTVVRTRLETLGPNRITELDRSLLKPITYITKE